jgi:hypothetical protein
MAEEQFHCGVPQQILLRQPLLDMDVACVTMQNLTSWCRTTAIACVSRGQVPILINHGWQTLAGLVAARGLTSSRYHGIEAAPGVIAEVSITDLPHHPLQYQQRRHAGLVLSATSYK